MLPHTLSLRTGQDAVDPNCFNVGSLRRLCVDFPRVKFCATILSRDNQHEITVLANKFSNLHLYGCWWFCNNPSIISEVTAQRLEILGTEFTAQHSDARVLDQLVYKWNHSRTVIGTVLVDKSARTPHPPASGFGAAAATNRAGPDSEPIVPAGTAT